MSLPGKGGDNKLVERPKSPLINTDLVKIPEHTSQVDRPERYTISSLYTAVNKNDLDKLINVLGKVINDGLI